MVNKTQIDTLQVGFPDSETRCVITGEFLRVDKEGLFVKRGEEEKLVATWSNENKQDMLEMDKVTVTKDEAVATYKGNFEIVSLTGTIDSMKGAYYSHFHMSAGDAQGHVVGGHLNQAVISATGEIIITLLDGSVDREFSPEVGLNILKF